VYRAIKLLEVFSYFVCLIVGGSAILHMHAELLAISKLIRDEFEAGLVPTMLPGTRYILMQRCY